ncbi:MAG: L-threonylcarbamoyladenylate synthase [Bdellovibrionales bacterium]
MGIVAVTDKSLKQASDIIKGGGLVAIPTETVYGLACNAFDEDAVKKVFEAKGRPAVNPLIVHISAVSDINKFSYLTPVAHKISKFFWPGPVTVILPLRDDSPIAPSCTAGLDTVAVRFPSHETARQLIQMAGVPIAAPSANASGYMSPTSPRHVYDSLGDKVDMILAGGACKAGLESTVIDATSDIPVILRYGVVTKEDIEQALKCNVLDGVSETTTIKSPGQLLKHYSPNIPIRMDAIDIEEGEALLAFGGTKFMGIRTGGAASDLPENQIRNLSESGDLEEAAKNLFTYMHDLDKPEFKGIAVMNIPNQGIGLAINDRLYRASKK